MCGRFYLVTPASELAQQFQMELPQLRPRYNIAPQQATLACRLEDGRRRPALLQWGLVPAWADDPGIGERMINARCETAAEKPSFRNALRSRRCLIPASGFYEWRRGPDGKQPFAFRMRDGRPFAFAGIWEHWERPEGLLQTFAILTTSPNDVMRPVHDRMPVIVAPRDYDLWLDPGVRDPGRIAHLFAPYPAEAMEAYPVSTRVNNPGNDDPMVLERVAEGKTLLDR
jgi:putative SOS response-associated peptidase YedK